MELVMDAIYNYGFFKNVRLIACDVEKGEVTLKDKNGNEIYDGDIVKGPTYSTCTGPGYRSTRTKEIVFEVKSNIGTYGYAFTISGNYDNNYRGFPRHEELEIIGNIYENKELLEDSHAK